MSRKFCGVLTMVWLVSAALAAAQESTVTGPRGAVPRATVTRAAARIDPPRLLPGTRANVFTTIQGNALNSTNNSLANANVRLRDARAGHIVGTQVSDQAGLFEFSSIDPGSYIVELLDTNRQSVLAASQVLTAGPGEAISAVVKLPFRVPPFGGLLGNATPSIATVTSQAASAGVLATQVAGAPTCEQVR
jgi:hypothetical protein